MKPIRTVSCLLRLYPKAWRERFGAELEELVREATGGGRVPWSMFIDLLIGAARERARAVKGRDAVLASLCGWSVFVVAGSVVQKASEHWQHAVPAGRRALPSAAFDTLIAAAMCGGLLVLIGIGLTLPRVLAFMRAGGWRQLRGRLLAACGLAAIAAMFTGMLAIWADSHSEAVFLTWVAAGIASLIAWTVVAVTIARRLSLPPATVRLEARLAKGLATLMLVMTMATAVWAAVQPVSASVVVAWALMVVATLVGMSGARRADLSSDL